MKVALVYDRVDKWGGAERVLLTLHQMFPRAPLYTAVYNSKTAPWARVFPKVVPSFLQKLPLLADPDHHELSAPFLPLAFESFDFSEFDLVISVTYEAAKGIITKPGTRHICFCLTPTRYLWRSYEFYFRSSLVRQLTQPLVSYLRTWDKIAAQRPDVMIAISKNVAGRIKRYYGRDSTVIYPPVELTTGPAARSSRPMSSRQALAGTRRDSLRSRHPSLENYFLVVSRLVPYKRIDLAVEAFNQLGLPLVVVGTGSEEQKLRRLAGDNIKFAGQVTDKEMAGYYQNCLALIFPQEEEFGITAVEAQSFGRPLIAYKRGGAQETVISGKTGIFFNQQTLGSLVAAVERFNPARFSASDCIKSARRFSKEKFFREFATLIATRG